jgi:DNA-directed RNA polymerase subunit RPC12/RpoP
MKISYKIRHPDFKKMTSEIICTECGKPFTEKVSNLRPGYSRKCPNCGVLIEFAGDNVAQKIRKALGDAFK